jgi:hypothetical protein
MALVRQLLLSLKSTCSWRSLLWKGERSPPDTYAVKFSGPLRPAE